jgi:hypothetical protein
MSCNNYKSQNQENIGNNELAQQVGSGSGGSNNAKQSIGQDKSYNKNS